MAWNRAVPEAISGAVSAMGAPGETGFGAASALLGSFDTWTSGQKARWTLGRMIGRSSAMERLFLQMRYLSGHLRVALIEGERGTGKRLLAETLHGLTPYPTQGFVHARAGEFLRDAEFAAKLEKARGGTLYLSGVDGLNGEEQARLLHLLGWLAAGPRGSFPISPAAVSRAGEDAAPAPRALLLSTERALRPLVLYGKFRNDLQQQLCAVHMVLPPLRERREDIPLLTGRLLQGLENARGRRLRGLAPDLLPALAAQRWPGNVRELEQQLAEAAGRCEGEWLRAGDLLPSTDVSSRLAVPHITGTAQTFSEAGSLHRQVWVARAGEKAYLHEVARPGTPEGSAKVEANQDFRLASQAEGDSLLDPNLDRAIMRHIRRVLAAAGGNKLRAARLLGISRSTLYRLLDAERVHIAS